jgi:hypothetical protein
MLVHATSCESAGIFSSAAKEERGLIFYLHEKKEGENDAGIQV